MLKITSSVDCELDHGGFLRRRRGGFGIAPYNCFFLLISRKLGQVHAVDSIPELPERKRKRVTGQEKTKLFEEGDEWSRPPAMFMFLDCFRIEQFAHGRGNNDGGGKGRG